jgi:hypothetical protein
MYDSKASLNFSSIDIMKNLRYVTFVTTEGPIYR